MTLLLNCSEIKKEYGELSVLKGVNMEINEGERIGLVGLNGAGKTTLANIIYGSIEKDAGVINWHRKDIKIGYLQQNVNYTENIFDVKPEEISAKNIEKELLHISSCLGMKKLLDWNEERLDNLSGGEKLKLVLSNIWALRPDFLIMDEPTNHLDYNGVQWLIKELQRYDGTVLIISHDRYFLDESVKRIIEIENGYANIYNGNYSFYRDEKKRRYDAQLNQFINQEKIKEKIAEQIDNLKNWSAKAHRESRKKAAAGGNKKGGKEYNRVKAKKMDKQIKSRIKRLEKIQIEGIERPSEEKNINFELEHAKTRGKRIIEAKNIKKQFGKLFLFSSSSFYILRGEKVGIFGENGCGKTTLLKMLIGEESIEEGELFISPSVKIAYLSQEVLDIRSNSNVIELFEISSKEQEIEVRTLLANMGFDDNLIKKPFALLSLGETTRIRIARLILQKNDVLILDEPMNHLDLHSREKLEEALEEYNGTILLVAHDRYMMERLCNKLLVFKNNEIKRIEYGLKEYLESDIYKNIKKQDKIKKTILDKLVLENKLAYVLGELCKYEPGDIEYKMLDLQYEELLKLKSLLQAQLSKPF